MHGKKKTGIKKINVKIQNRSVKKKNNKRNSPDF